jgi:hypothetical protein
MFFAPLAGHGYKSAQPTGANFLVRHGYVLATKVMRFDVARGYGRLHGATEMASLYIHLSAINVTLCTGWLHAFYWLLTGWSLVRIRPGEPMTKYCIDFAGLFFDLSNRQFLAT